MLSTSWIPRRHKAGGVLCVLRAGVVWASVVLSVPVYAADFPVFFGTNEQHHFDQALRYLNMSGTDLAFAKDVGTPMLALERTRRFLRDPLQLPAFAQRMAEIHSTCDPTLVWASVRDLLTVTNQDPVIAPEVQAHSEMEDTPSVLLSSAVQRFSEATKEARIKWESALRGLNDEERRYLAASYFGGLFFVEDRAPVRAALIDMGATSQDVERVIAEGMTIDPKPASTNWLALVQRIDLQELLEAGRMFQDALASFEGGIRSLKEWPNAPVRYDDVVIGTLRDDTYSDPAILIFDPGGNDTYTGAAGVANGLKGQPFAAVLDLEGNDRYLGVKLLGPGSALFGCCAIIDVAGNDLHRAGYAGQASAVYGTAWFEDRAGEDVYKAYGHAQAAASVGFAYFREAAGPDSYDLGFIGQAYAGVLGVAVLVDEAGNDRYFAGGVEVDYDHNEKRFLSFAQGFAIGMRPYAGGGVAALIDLGGSDVYQADIFAQAVSYWYSVGLLLDAAGDDRYSMYHYGQGSGIHLSSALLADGAGDDFYTGFALSQGNAHDYAVGMLFDHAGNDTYTADHYSQGRAINNGFAWLADSAGHDAYFGRQNDACQGIGNNGGLREYGSLAILTDLEGSDQYSCGATNGCRMRRPDFGIVYDVWKDDR